MGIRSKNTNKSDFGYLSLSTHGQVRRQKKQYVIFSLKPFTCSGTENRSAEGKKPVSIPENH
jgi:hypothetical protein